MFMLLLCFTFFAELLQKSKNSEKLHIHYVKL